MLLQNSAKTTTITTGTSSDGYYLKINNEAILPDAGHITHEQAEQKALSEYEKFRVIQDKEILSDFDRHCKSLFNEDM